MTKQLLKKKFARSVYLLSVTDLYSSTAQRLGNMFGRRLNVTICGVGTIDGAGWV